MIYSGFNILPRSVIRRQTGFAARITRTLSGSNNMAPPPSLSDWELDAPFPWPPRTDEGYAFHHFFGKSFEEAAVVFFENPYGASEDFTYMPDTCRQYYIGAWATYLLGDGSNDSDAANCYVSTLGQLLQVFIHCDKPTRALLQNALSAISSAPEEYGIPEVSQAWMQESIAESILGLENA